MRFTEESRNGIDHCRANLIQRVHFFTRLDLLHGAVFARDSQRRIVKRLPRAVTARECFCGCLAYLADAERVDEPLERNLTAGLDRGQQFAHRDFAEALLCFELGLFRLELKDLRGLANPVLVVEELNLLLAEAFDVEGQPRNEMPQMLGLLKRAGELSRAARARALFARGGDLANDLGVQRTRAL